MSIDWTAYPARDQYDELVGPGGGARAAGRALMRYLSELDKEEIGARQQAAELAIKEMGITFTVYHEQDGSIDRAWPLDIIPRTIARKEWVRIEAGLKQRVAALNRFIDDVYHDQRIVAAGVFPASIIATSRNYRPMCVGHPSAARVLGAHLRQRYRARQGRHRVRARGQPARAVGRLLHDREPTGRQARISGAVRERGNFAG